MISGRLGEGEWVFSNVREGISISRTEANKPFLKYHMDCILSENSSSRMTIDENGNRKV